MINIAENTFIVTDETPIPGNHRDVEENPDSNYVTAKVKAAIDDLLLKNKFTKNYGAKMVTSDLRTLGFAESEIPFKTQISNRISYFWSQHLQFNNGISPGRNLQTTHLYRH